MKIVVVGGTGLIGSKLVSALGAAGHEVISAARSTGVDTVSGHGLRAALAGADVVVDVASPGYRDSAEALWFFTTSTRNLVATERDLRIAHHIVFSAIGAGRVGGGYYRAKDAQEALVEASGIPFTIVRSAPLFEYLYDLYEDGRGEEVVRVPPLRVQPIAADDAVEVLSRLVSKPPSNAIVEVAGPVVYRVPELAEQILTANEDYRRVMVDGNATFFGARVTGASLTAAPAGTTRFEDWVARSVVPA
jgi:uncharacterized protein YbjT (DUF2867 family)